MGSGPQENSARPPAPAGVSPYGAAGLPPAVAAPGPAPPRTRRPTVLTAPPDAPALLRALRRRWLTAALFGPLAGVAAAAAVWSVIPPSPYVAKAMLHVASNQPSIIFPTQEVRANFEIYKQTQLRLLKGRSVLSAVIHDPQVKGLDLVKRAARQGDLITWLEREIQAEYTGEILSISMSGNGPDGLATLVNAVADAYLEEVVNVEAKERRERYGQLQAIYADYSKRLKAKRAELEALAQRIGSADQSNVRLTHALALENRALMERELLRLRMDLRQAEVELAVRREAAASHPGTVPGTSRPGTVPGEGGGAAADQAVQGDGLILQYQSRIRKLKAELDYAGRLARNPNDPSVRRPQDELRKLTRLLQEREASLRQSLTRTLPTPVAGGPPYATADLEGRIKVLKEMEKLVAADVKNLANDAGAINTNSMSLETVQNEIAIADAAAKRVGGEVEALNVELGAPSRVRLIEPADTPHLAADNRLRSSGLAGAAALALVLAGVSFVEYRARRVGSADEVVDGLGLRLVGTLPALPRRPSRARAGRDAAGVPLWQTRLLEAVDNTRTHLLHTADSLHLRSVIVTSAQGREGKTSLATNLATSIARAGRRTLLIDGDLRCPDVHGIFDLPARPGLSELLRGEADAERVIQPAAVRNLWVVTAGFCDDQALRALAQERFGALFDGLKARFDFIVVDAPPLLPIADAALIARHTDASVQAVLAGASTLPMVYAAHERLEGLGVRALGVVVAGVRGSHCGSSYEHYRRRTEPALRPGDE